MKPQENNDEDDQAKVWIPEGVSTYKVNALQENEEVLDMGGQTSMCENSAPPSHAPQEQHDVPQYRVPFLHEEIDEDEPYARQAQLKEQDDVGQIQCPCELPHPRVHQSIQRDHPVDNILGSIRRGVTTCSRLANFCEFYSFVFSLESLKVEQALDDPDWVMAMQEELNNFTRNEIWSLVERPKQNVIGTKWVLYNK